MGPAPICRSIGQRYIANSEIKVLLHRPLKLFILGEMNVPICGIYKIENLVNGKCYIGQSVDIKRRWRSHKSCAFNSTSEGYDRPLYKAIRKYGLNNFSFEVLEECDRVSLNKRETYWIKVFNSMDNGYNLDEGGDNCIHYDVLSKGLIEQITQELMMSLESSDKIGEKYGVSGRTIRMINTGDEAYRDYINYPIRKNLGKLKAKNQGRPCEVCGKFTYNKKFCSPECASTAQRIIKRPSREELKQMIRIVPFRTIGQKYGISDNSIKRWCKTYNLPYRKKDINQYSDEEWNNI